MRVLAITYAFVPLRFPATFRLLKWFKGLEELGHSVTVLSVHPDSFIGPKDDSLNRLVASTTTAIQVESPENSLLFRALSRRRSWFYRLFEPRKMEWYSPCKRALTALNLPDFDVVLSCSQPPVGHLLGLYAKRKSGLPWVAFFSDPWVNSPFQSYTSRRIERHNRELQREVVALSDRLVFPSSEVRDQVLEGYSGEERKKCEVLPHCYVPSWYDLGTRGSPEGDPGTKVLLTGNFYGPRSPLPFLNVLNDIRKTGGLANDLTVEMYGSISEEYLGHPVWSELEGVVQFKGGIDYLSSLAKMKQADCLLLIDAPTDDESSIFFPSKLADYIGSGTPIVGFTPARGVSARVLRETGNVVASMSDEASMREAVQRMIDGDHPRRKRDGNDQYDYRVVARQLEQILGGGDA